MKYTLPDAQNCLFKWQQDKFFKNGKTGYKGNEASVYDSSLDKNSFMINKPDDKYFACSSSAKN